MMGHNWTPPGAYIGRGIEINTYVAPNLQVWEVLCRCADGCGNHGMNLELLLAWSVLRSGNG